MPSANRLWRDLSPLHLSPSRRLELTRATRSFTLRPHELVQLHGYQAGDFLFLAAGALAVTLPEGSHHLLAEHSQTRLPLPDGTDPVVIRAEQDSLFYHVDRDQLDFLLAWDELQGLLAGTNSELRRRMDKVQNALAFRRLPSAALFEAIRRMESREVAVGDLIIRQGETVADAFFMIDRGQAAVWKSGIFDASPQCVATLSEGDTFGEEALVTGYARSASVRMVTDGTLLVLKKEDFDELVSRPLLREITAAEAYSLAGKGYRLLDVRHASEYAAGHIPGALSYPLNELRARVTELDPAGKYIAYCQSGKRSAVAALLLSQRNYRAVSLCGGLREWPYETQSI